jgi:hypothetical protein
VDVGVGRDCGDLHDFGGGGNVFGMGREEFEDTVDGSFGTSLKIHGLQPEVIFVTPSEWKAPVRRVVVVAHHPPLCSSLRNVLNKAKIVRMSCLQNQ